MLNIKQITKEPKRIEALLKRKDASLSLQALLDAYEAYCKAKTELEEAQSLLNRLSKEIGEKKRQGVEVAPLMQEVSSIKERGWGQGERQWLVLVF